MPNNQPIAPIKPGYLISFTWSTLTLRIVDDQHRQFNWPSGSSKEPIEFIRSVHAFAEFAQTIADLFGLRVRKIPDTDPQKCIVFEFFDPAQQKVPHPER